MAERMSRSSPVILSICITTFNRGKFIGDTLDSIISQMTDGCEIVVLDGGSKDETPEVVSKYAQRHHYVRYVRQDTNNGFDRDCDRLVTEFAAGVYCWLTSDDDLLKPGAVKAVLDVIRRGVSVVVVNVEARDFYMAKIVQKRWLNIMSDRFYGSNDMDRLLADVGDRYKYVGGIVVDRALWLARERKQYYDSWFVFLGVIFQQPLPQGAVVMAEPLISFRMSNVPHTWSPHVIEIVWFRWPSLIWSLPVSERAKTDVCPLEPWRRPQDLLLWRALGPYSLGAYRKWIRPRVHSLREKVLPAVVALLPGVLVNAFLVSYYSMARKPFQGWRQPSLMVHDLRDSPFYFRNWRLFKRARAQTTGSA